MNNENKKGTPLTTLKSVIEVPTSVYKTMTDKRRKYYTYAWFMTGMFACLTIAGIAGNLGIDYMQKGQSKLNPIGRIYDVEEVVITVEKWRSANNEPKEYIAWRMGQVMPEEELEIFLATIAHESGFNRRAKGWNCMYGTVSTACAPEDRNRAWSVDCGILQINVSGQECPEELYDVITNVEAGVGKYQRQGLGAWVSYNTGRYQAYMN